MTLATWCAGRPGRAGARAAAPGRRARATSPRVNSRPGRPCSSAVGQPPEPPLVDRRQQRARRPSRRSRRGRARRASGGRRAGRSRRAPGASRPRRSRSRCATKIGPRNSRLRAHTGTAVDGEQHAGVRAEVAADDRVRAAERARLAPAARAGRRRPRRPASPPNADQAPRAHRHRRARLEDPQHVAGSARAGPRSMISSGGDGHQRAERDLPRDRAPSGRRRPGRRRARRTTSPAAMPPNQK